MTALKQTAYSVPSLSLAWIIDPETGDNIISVNGEHVKTFSVAEGYAASQFVCERYPGIPCVLRFGEDGSGFVLEISPSPKPDQELYYSIETLIHRPPPTKLPFWRQQVSFTRWKAYTWMACWAIGFGLATWTVVDLINTCGLVLTFPPW